MTAEEKSVLSLFMIGVLIVVGKVLAGGEPITPRLFIGRMLLGGFVSMVAGVVLVQFPDLSLPAVCGIGSMLGTAIHREAGRSPRRKAAPVAVRAANYVDVITNRKPLSRGAFLSMWSMCGRDQK